MMRMWYAASLALLGGAALVQGNAFGTIPYADAVFRGPQTIPGTVLLAYYDEGGPEVAYHSHDITNQGSCALNPCDGTYINTFRKNDSASTSYTKPPNGGWPGDRFAANNFSVPPFQLYWGWLAVGDWVRVSLNVTEDSDYSVDVFSSCNSGGQITVSAQSDSGAMAVQRAVVPSTGSYHLWATNSQLLDFRLPAGPAVLTVNVTGVDGEGQFGNILSMAFNKVSSRGTRRLRQ